MRTRGEVWTALRQVRMPKIKMGLRTVEQLQRIAPNLRSLDLLQVQKHCDEVLPFSSFAEDIVFPRSSRMTDAGLCATLNACPNLRAIEWMECNQISDVSMEHTVVACPKLSRVKLTRCTWVTGNTLMYLSGASRGDLHRLSTHTGTKNEGVLRITRGAAKGGNGGAHAKITMERASREVFKDKACDDCRQLEWLELNQCEALCSASMMGLRHLCGSLKTLSLKGCCAIDHKVAPHIALCTRLTMLDLAWVGIDDEGVRQIAECCPQLSVLGLSSTQITDLGIWWLTPRFVSKRIRGEGLPADRVSESQLRLRQISLRSCQKLSKSAAQLITAWPSLEAIDMGGLPIDLDFVRSVGWVGRKCQQFHRTEMCPLSLFNSHSHMTVLEDFE